jgi:hypothetical protein
VSEPRRPVSVGATVAQEGATWRASWTVDPSSPGRYEATTSFWAPSSVEGATDAGWAQARAGAPHVVIASEALSGAAAALVEHRRGQGLESVLVKVEDLYDAFADGRRDPRAVRDFLAFAVANWANPPSYVCLAGDGHLDYHDVYGQAATRPNHVPPIQSRIPYFTPSGGTQVTLGIDNPLADQDGDGSPDLAIGRLPVSTSAALTRLIDRMKVHESADAWKSRIVLVADKDDGNVFGAALDRVAAGIPATMGVQRLTHTASTPTATMQAQFLAAMNSGPLVSIYVGHANNVGISSPYFFEHSYVRSNMGSLTNWARAPVVVAGTCMLNDFAPPHPNNRSIGKGMLDTAPGGAVAVWASSAEATLAMAESTSKAILDALFDSHDARLGDLAWPALQIQANGASPWTARSSVLLGDPGLRVRTHLYVPGRAWDTGYQALGGGWRRLGWFGDYAVMGGEGWIWHNRHGFYYVPPNSTPESVWRYAADMGWTWTSATTYPFFYRAQDGAWLWYNGSTGPRWFMNMTANRWEAWP